MKFLIIKQIFKNENNNLENIIFDDSLTNMSPSIIIPMEDIKEIKDIYNYVIDGKGKYLRTDIITKNGDCHSTLTKARFVINQENIIEV